MGVLVLGVGMDKKGSGFLVIKLFKSFGILLVFVIIVSGDLFKEKFEVII